MDRQQMEAEIERGRGVLYGGRIITHVEHLPTEEELARNDAGVRQTRREQIEKQIGELQAELDRLKLEERPDGLPATGAAADAPDGGPDGGQGDEGEKETTGGQSPEPKPEKPEKPKKTEKPE